MGVALQREAKEIFADKNMHIYSFFGQGQVDYPEHLFESMKFTTASKNNRKNSEVFKNKRSQYYFNLANMIYSTFQAVVNNVYTDPDKLISFSSKIHNLRKLKSQLAKIPRIYNNQNNLEVGNKRYIEQKKIPSPNEADALMMSLATGNRRSVSVVVPKSMPSYMQNNMGKIFNGHA